MRTFCLFALAVAIGLATAASPFASASPDALEKVAERKGFIEQGRLAVVQKRSPVPGYAFPGIGDARLATGLAGLAGTLLVFGTAWGVVRVARRPVE